MKMQFFDFEVFPHWWCCTFGILPDNITKMEELTEDVKNDFLVITSDEKNAREHLLSVMQDKDTCNIGYNVKYYDLIIANAIYQGFQPEQIKIINDIIINPSLMYSTKEHMRLAPFAKRKLKNIVYQDLLDDGTGSLKEKEAIIGLNILESEVDFNTEVLTEENKQDIIYYNKHDVWASMKFYLKIVLPYTKTKLALGKTFNIPESTCHMSTNAKLVSLVLGAKRSTFSDAETIEITIPTKIRQYLYDNIPSKILEQLRTSSESFDVRLFNNDVTYGNGGIHSVYSKNLYVEADEDYALVNIDATSYYPSMLIQFNCLSRTVEHPEIFKMIFDKRVEIKHKAVKTMEDEEAQRAYKLVLNTTYGASGNKYLDLYDPHQTTKCCRLGQLTLSALACRIVHSISSAKIIQTNTDGLLLYIHRKDIPMLRQLEQEWTAVTGINMEEEEYSKIWQRDVNNYLMVDTKGHTKYKGSWLNDCYERPGYVAIGPLTAFVCTKAAQKWLLNKEDIVQNIVKNNDIRDFAITCTKGPTYSGVVQVQTNGEEISLYKCNRILASKDTTLGKLYKIKKYKDRLSYTKMPNTPDHCRTINLDLDSYTERDWKNNLDYMYYVNRTLDILDIDWYKLKNGEFTTTKEFDYIIS